MYIWGIYALLLFPGKIKDSFSVVSYFQINQHNKYRYLKNLPVVVFYTVVKVPTVDYKVWVVVPNHSVDHRTATDVVAVHHVVVVLVGQVDHFAKVLLEAGDLQNQAV